MPRGRLLQPPPSGPGARGGVGRIPATPVRQAAQRGGWGGDHGPPTRRASGNYLPAQLNRRPPLPAHVGQTCFFHGRGEARPRGEEPQPPPAAAQAVLTALTPSSLETRLWRTTCSGLEAATPRVPPQPDPGPQNLCASLGQQGPDSSGDSAPTGSAKPLPSGLKVGQAHRETPLDPGGQRSEKGLELQSLASRLSAYRVAAAAGRGRPSAPHPPRPAGGRAGSVGGGPVCPAHLLFGSLPVRGPELAGGAAVGRVSRPWAQRFWQQQEGSDDSNLPAESVPALCLRFPASRLAAPSPSSAPPHGSAPSGPGA